MTKVIGIPFLHAFFEPYRFETVGSNISTTSIDNMKYRDSASQQSFFVVTLNRLSDAVDFYIRIGTP
ncbi:hypothetical protein SPACI_039800 [Sporomusa acidovorans DSM 3132]|uniref:Uncharacterized protein n=1 Tax=Sporomusa acidovorans (strain ATCC 49682 / DSM 3132 / Mol) TaxID=1123286 RepID=A0ABZ3J7J9_SPOA4|nr:hypothetical protein SPACI_33680 [Sporomusa acidovorans DSM 3132]SDE36764.1 hypothetical protein SAMN04488499_101238 [Sporomusa acidovorans]